ncbi:MAG: phosphatase PAP2 family protein, partial [Gammaproteobacteria bacterium]|nr:phosphatase PAP2 family protein [Gammaproteobacteria bacterium]
KNTRVRSFFLVYASVISLSRIACGVHWPLDVLGGMFFGWLAAFISFTLFQKYSANGLLSQRITASLLLLASIHLIFLHDGGDKEARFLEILTPVICLILSLKGLKSLFLDPILLFLLSKRAK